MKKNGFTLIELLAVIVILGVILVIAIPSISAAILNSRKKAYVATANELVDGVRMAILNDASLLPEGTTPKYFNISNIKIEKGSKTTSSFHKNYTASSYIQVRYNETTDEYIYSVCLVDEAGNGIGEVNNNPINIKDIEVSHISIGGATCTLNGTGGGGTGGDDGETFVGNPSDWIVSTEPNATGGYTLLAFIGDLENSSSVDVFEDYYSDTDNNLSINYKMAMEIVSASEMANRNAYTVSIPNVVDGKTITELGPSLFQAVDYTTEEYSFIEAYSRIKEVNIPEGIVKINGYFDEENYNEYGSFFVDYNLTEVTLPSTLTYIGPYSFHFNPLLEIIIPKKVEFIGELSFAESNSIETLIFEGAEDGTSKLEIIEAHAFGVGNITSLTIPSSVKYLSGFEYNYLTEIIIPSSVTTIGDSAFEKNNITSLIIPKNVITIESEAFRDNPLTSLVFDGTSTNGTGNDISSLTTLGIDYGAIFDVDNVNSIIYIPSSVTSMDQHVFGCDYRDSLCTFYINHTTIPETYDYSWAGNYARKYILNGSGGYTCVENCP